MGMLQASSFNLRPTGSAHQFHVEAQRVRPRKIVSRATRQLNSDRRPAPLDMGNDWAVVQQAIAGNVDAQEQLFARHTGRLYRTAFAVLRNKEDAEDALQEGLCKAYTSLRSFQGRSSFISWLTRIVLNAALMSRRRKKAHPEFSLDQILDSQLERLPKSVVDVRLDPEKIYAATEVHTLIEQHVRQLPARLQEAYRLRANRGLSATESSQALGIPTSAYKSRILRARRRLIHELRQLPGGIECAVAN
jgi:RNA polymerase sigma-70 factor (ECF subfamily)